MIEVDCMTALLHFTTPMMRQYEEVKKRYQDSLLFFRMGDFYELFLEDAHIGASVLNITLTKKNGGKDGKIPMAGVPYHAVDTYISKLVKAGYKVAICEQLTPPNKRGIVERDVVRVITPGTLLDENSLEKKKNNYIVSIQMTDTAFSFAVADLSTGFFATHEASSEDTSKTLIDEISRLEPSECILPDELYNDTSFLKLLRSLSGLNIYPFSRWHDYARDAHAYLKNHFGIKTLESFGIDHNTYSFESAAALLGYLKETQKGNIMHVKKLIPLGDSDGLVLDRSTIINLELFSTIREHDTRGSLLSVLDQTTTAMGGRLLKGWMKKPLITKELIEERLCGVSTLLEHGELQKSIREELKKVPDIERLLSRLSVNLGNARDLIQLKNALNTVLQLKKLMGELDAIIFKKQSKTISDNLTACIEIIEQTFVDEPPFGVRDGGMIREGIDEKLDTLLEKINKSKSWIIDLEKKERQRTGIGSLKVRFNKVFGYYIEVSKANVHLVPKEYMRKQTLVNGERFITKELKIHEELILTSEENTKQMEYEIFYKILLKTMSYTEHIQNASESIAVLDCISTFAYVSEKRRYIKPKILYSGEIRIKNGRHPVVEELLDDTPFISNDVTLDNVSQSMLLITGPNMAGKSVFIRQVALIVLIAQIGCFVPATSAHISVVDRIFVRSGASDVITSGLSTFMVEMVETAHILHRATEKSLIVMDEIGRGTSTYDGISIAWSVAEYLVTHLSPSPKTLFATHYHELQDLEKQFPYRIKNFHMAVTSENGEPVFLHTILPGGASHSFGVSVAKLAGIPEEVIKRANELLKILEARKTEDTPPPDNEKTNQIDLISFPTSTFVSDSFLRKEFESIDIAHMSPLDALNKLSELKEKLRILTSEKRYLEVD